MTADGQRFGELDRGVKQHQQLPGEAQRVVIAAWDSMTREVFPLETPPRQGLRGGSLLAFVTTGRISALEQAQISVRSYRLCPRNIPHRSSAGNSR
jgi:hypothetical protein